LRDAGRIESVQAVTEEFTLLHARTSEAGLQDIGLEQELLRVVFQATEEEQEGSSQTNARERLEDYYHYYS